MKNVTKPTELNPNWTLIFSCSRCSIVTPTSGYPRHPCRPIRGSHFSQLTNQRAGNIRLVHAFTESPPTLTDSSAGVKIIRMFRNFLLKLSSFGAESSILLIPNSMKWNEMLHYQYLYSQSISIVWDLLKDLFELSEFLGQYLAFGLWDMYPKILLP